MAGAGALARLAAPSTSPLWGSLGPHSNVAPLLGAALAPLSGLFTQSLILLIVIYLVDRKPRLAGLWIVVGLAFAGAGSIETIPSWLILGATTGIVLLLAYTFVFRHQPELIVITMATLSILGAVRDGVQQMYPAALAGSIAAAVLVAVVAWMWFRGSIGNSVSDV